jgi:hypothetical protein
MSLWGNLDASNNAPNFSGVTGYKSSTSLANSQIDGIFGNTTISQTRANVVFGVFGVDSTEANSQFTSGDGRNVTHAGWVARTVGTGPLVSITGTGVKAVQQLENEYNNIKGEMAYPYPIHRNAIPQCDVFEENGYTKEEMKLVRETQKILDDRTIAVTATAIRIPVVGGHSESVNITFSEDFDINEVRNIESK